MSLFSLCTHGLCTESRLSSKKHGSSRLIVRCPPRSHQLQVGKFSATLSPVYATIRSVFFGLLFSFLLHPVFLTCPSLLSCFSPSRKGLSPEMVRPPLASDLPPGPWRSETAPWLSFRSLALCSISSVKCTLHIVRDAGLQDLLKLLLQKVHMCDFSSVCSVFMWCLRSLLRIKFATNCSTFLYGILGNYSERRFCSKLYMHARSFPHESTLCAG